jgi:hypothetical protein
MISVKLVRQTQTNQALAYINLTIKIEINECGIKMVLRDLTT